MTNHLLKCRRNYEKAFRENGEMIQMMTCKYNWCHQVPVPELLYHERSCVDRYSVIMHLLEFTNRKYKQNK